MCKWKTLEHYELKANTNNRKIDETMSAGIRTDQRAALSNLINIVFNVERIFLKGTWNKLRRKLLVKRIKSLILCRLKRNYCIRQKYFRLQIGIVRQKEKNRKLRFCCSGSYTKIVLNFKVFRWFYCRRFEIRGT